MKKTLVLLLLLVTSLAYGQNEPADAFQRQVQENKMTCQHIEINPDNNNITLKDNVKIQLDNLYAEADSAVWDDKNKILVAYGTKEFKFKGEAIISETADNTIRYKLNDKTLYVE
jgi:lipopolysaccharide assembly outer membrane protein LptD (OstA)